PAATPPWADFCTVPVRSPNAWFDRRNSHRNHVPFHSTTCRPPPPASALLLQRTAGRKCTANRTESDMNMKRSGTVLALLALAACGSDNGGPAAPSAPVPQIAGRFTGWPLWTVQWNRSRDNVIG